MIAALSRTLLALAVHCLGNHRRDWAVAMQVEFEDAREDRRPLAFALGCLTAACRELPMHDEGRFAIARHVLALGVIVPVAALMVSSILTGFPSSFLGHVGVHDLLEMSTGQGPLLSEGNRFAIPALALLVLLLSALNLRIAWLALEGDWERLAKTGALTAAATATLFILSAVVFVDLIAALTQAAVLTVELSAAAALARWQTRLPAPAPDLPPH